MREAAGVVDARLRGPAAEFWERNHLRRGVGAVAPGGLLLIVTHGSVAPWSWDRAATVSDLVIAARRRGA